MNEQRVMSDTKVLEAYEGEHCLVCDGRKLPRRTFCTTDFLALPLISRNLLYRGPEDPAFCDAFRSALRHLQLNQERVRKYPVRVGEWPYQSDHELDEAGYVFSGHDRCRVPGCNERIVWYWMPDRKRKVPVNLANYQPHRTSCIDPEFFTRARERQQAIKRSKKRA